MKRLKRRLHKESAIDRRVSDMNIDVPVTDQERTLCQYIQDEIEGELNEEMGLNLTCGCNWHNPGEEQHIEIFVGIPEDDDPSDPKYDNIETFLEQFVNKIGDAENEGEKWGDASFQWISDEEIFGELWPLNGELANESKKKLNESPYYDDDDESCPTNGRVRKTCWYCGNTVIADEEGEYVCPYCGYDSELQDDWNESTKKFGKKFSKESSVNDYDTQDYGDENYEEPNEFDIKARELGEEWDELGTKTKNEYCESLWYVIGNWIATNRLDEKTAEAILWEAVMSSYDRTDVYEVIMKMVENGKNSTLARKKK